MELPDKLKAKLEKRKNSDSLRTLVLNQNGVDFFSNDYLGLSRSEHIFNAAHETIAGKNELQNGSTGSRLISGNTPLHIQVESELAKIHKSESALLYNSGYDANLGFFSCVPQRHDVIFYDELIHASIRDGIRLSNAKSFSFKHNNLEHLEKKIIELKSKEEVYIVTETIFSMDGDSPDLTGLIELTKKYNCKLIMDEAHALGVFDLGIVQKHNLQDYLFARIMTFGKGLGCHGAIVLCSAELKSYLSNFSRSFIYTTALPPHAIATIQFAYRELITNSALKNQLRANIFEFKAQCKQLELDHLFTNSDSAIQSCIIKTNKSVKSIAHKIIDKGFNVKAILYPTVPLEEERIRFCIHSYNTKEEIVELLHLLKSNLSK